MKISGIGGGPNLGAGGAQGANAGQGQGHQPVAESPMLSRLLDDNISVATGPTSMSTPVNPLHQGSHPPHPGMQQAPPIQVRLYHFLFWLY